MADVLLIRSSCGFRIFCTSRCRVWRNIRHLRTLTGYTGQPLVKIRSGHNLLGITKTCSSCVRVNRLSSQAEVVLSSQVAATESSTQLEKSKKYQPLHVMPFSVMQGGKYVAHVLLKHKPNRAIVFVRTKVLAVELIRELAEYGLECLSPERVDKTEATDEEENEQQEKDALEENSERLEPNQRITVVTEGEVAAMESLLPADLILLVQQPMTGKSFALFCLKKTHAKVRPLDVMLLYSHNDLAFLSQLKTHVDIKKLPPPSFHNVPMMTEGLPSLPGESVVIPGRHLIEPPPPAITATIPPKVPRSILFQPSIPVPVKQSERHRLKDQCRIYVRGGSGGQGSSSFGGMGGDGGDVVVQSFPDVTLDHFSVKENRRILAEHGTYFSGKRGKRRKGFRGRDTVIPVPIGTSVCTDDGQIMAELDEVGSRVVVAKGGRGGSPAMENWRGEKGERAMIRLEMRLIADVALVGFPNAGKSSLLSAISKATPKTADYAFTTMRPNIGIVEYSDHSQVSVADLPGLIEGASANRGLGHSFLKHTQKASSLALVVDIDGFHLSDKFPARTALQNVFILLQELVLYDKELLNRPKMLIVTKLDKKGATSRFQELRQSIQSIQHGTLLSVLQEIHSSSPVVQDDTDLMDLSDELARIRFDSIIPVSAVTSFGLDDLRDKIKALL